MGSRNLDLVFEHWTHLDHKQRALLMYLAHACHGDWDPPVYFGGWKNLARAIGVSPYGDEKHRKAAQEKVRTGMAALISAGAVVRGIQGKEGKRGDYALTLEPHRSVVKTGAAWRTFVRKSDGSPYKLLLSTWRPVDRADPRPAARVIPTRDPLDETGDVPLDETGDVPLGQPGDHPLDEPGRIPWTNQGPNTSEPPSDSESSISKGDHDAVVTSRGESSRAVEKSRADLIEEVEDQEKAYQAAYERLMTSPQTYMDRMDRAREELGDDATPTALVIHAATIHLDAA